MSHEDLKSKGRDFARYALLNESRGRVFKRDDISKLGLLGTQTRQFPAILQYCNRELQATFGMELIETRARGMNAEKVALEAEQARKASRNSQRQKNTQRDVSEEEEGTQANAPAATKSKAGTASKQYILRSALSADLIAKVNEVVDTEIPRDYREGSWIHEENDVLDWKRGGEVAHQGVLGFILAVILTHGRTIEDQQLRTYLKRLRINDVWQPPNTPASIRPPTNLDGLLDVFIRQRYLECIQLGGKGGGSQQTATQSNKRRQSQGTRGEGVDHKREWRWGARAEIEFGEQSIAHFIVDLFKEAGSNQNRQGNGDASTSANGVFRPDQSIPFSKKKLLSDITKAAGSELQDADRLIAAGGQEHVADI